MKFLVFCPVTNEGLQERIGRPEYSYRFVLEGFRPALERIGNVTEVADPNLEADRLHDEARAAGQCCRLICFCPPNLAPIGLRCPTTVVLAWEFDTIPTIPWDCNPRNDWRTVLAEHGQVITLSHHSRQAVEEALGDRCRVSTIPVPLPVPTTKVSCLGNVANDAEIVFRGHINDSRELLHTPDGCLPTETIMMRSGDWNGDDLTFSFHDQSDGSLSVIGFYDAEEWGVWSRVVNPVVVLPFPLFGKVELQLTALAYGRNIGREVSVTIGERRFPIVLTRAPATHTNTITLEQPSNLLRLGPLDITQIPGAVDTRTMGIGLVKLRVKKKKSLLPWFLRSRQLDGLAAKLGEPQGKLQLSGVVFTSVLNPTDGRKNWEDIVTAFCYALGDRTDTTLVLKMTHHSPTAYAEKFYKLMASVGQVTARIVVVHGFLEKAEYQKMIAATNWYVNASRGEGLCLPLMEFMSAGVPAIAPKHTAMADYIDNSCALTVCHSRTPTVWPNDPLKRNRTRWYDINWKTLVDRFREGYSIARDEPNRYSAMGASAAAAVNSYASCQRVERLLTEHFRVAY